MTLLIAGSAFPDSLLTSSTEATTFTVGAAEATAVGAALLAADHLDPDADAGTASAMVGS